jgi:hypothetical protein
VRERTKDLGCHKDGKFLTSPEVLTWPVAADLASEQKGHDRGWRVRVFLGNKEGQGGGTPFIPR